MERSHVLACAQGYKGDIAIKELIIPGADDNITFPNTFKVVVDANGNIRVENEKLIYDGCY